mmetsp:Transcript_49135/g.110485  ORF Transcript_49135/g.110485 Transcript_49135/m.110485 type:complete len:172 (-) Transcript_49135:519-1034(-)
MQAYIQRLKEVERSCSEVRERGVSAQQKLSDEWGAWMEMLCSCARQLQSRADAGEERAQIGSMETPAAAVLETAHRLITECGMLRNVGRKFDTKEAALKDKFERAQHKIDVLLLEKQERKSNPYEKPFGMNDATLPSIPGAVGAAQGDQRVDVVGSHLLAVHKERSAAEPE